MTLEDNTAEDISSLQDKLASVDAADAPEVAEELAGRLGEHLDPTNPETGEAPSDET
ncbi:MAG: hypothetical protein ACR2N7_00720 [Acidimicrobiia bacterium]